MMDKKYYINYRKINREKNRIYQKQYRKKYPEKNREARKRYYQLHGKNKAKRFYMKRVGERDGMACRKCGSTENLTLQHKLPKCIGGKMNLKNLEILCFKCNVQDYHLLVKKALKFYFEHNPIV